RSPGGPDSAVEAVAASRDSVALTDRFKGRAPVPLRGRRGWDLAEAAAEPHEDPLRRQLEAENLLDLRQALRVDRVERRLRYLAVERQRVEHHVDRHAAVDAVAVDDPRPAAGSP